jgi:hypothetical protein
MGTIASMTTGGVLERHPGLRCAFLQLIPVADLKALRLVDGFEKAVYAALGSARVTGSLVPERAGSSLLGASRS